MNSIFNHQHLTHLAPSKTAPQQGQHSPGIIHQSPQHAYHNALRFSSETLDGAI